MRLLRVGWSISFTLLPALKTLFLLFGCLNKRVFALCCCISFCPVWFLSCFFLKKKTRVRDQSDREGRWETARKSKRRRNYGSGLHGPSGKGRKSTGTGSLGISFILNRQAEQEGQASERGRFYWQSLGLSSQGALGLDLCKAGSVLPLRELWQPVWL